MMDHAEAPTPVPDTIFDTARITAEVGALADRQAGNNDAFRAALSHLLKAELVKAREAVQATLLKDRHGRHCAERLCFVQDEIIRILFDAATHYLYRSPIPSGVSCSAMPSPSSSRCRWASSSACRR